MSGLGRRVLAMRGPLAAVAGFRAIGPAHEHREGPGASSWRRYERTLERALASSRAGLLEFPIELTKVIGSDFGELQRRSEL